MSNDISALGPGPACETGKLIVQVVGKDHPDTQKLLIHDQGNAAAPYWLSQQDKPEIQSSETFSSVLHVWDWDSQPGRSLWLAIATLEGEPIYVPLHDDLRVTPRQLAHHLQWNQIVPAVPMVALPGSKSTQDPGTPVMLRAGYLYIFYRGLLWRELEVREVDGKASYHDIDIRAHRQGDGFCRGPRQARGVALADIWLPAQWNDWHSVDIQMCFSEVQLGAARLQRLEHDGDLRRKRCQSFDLRASRQKFQDLYRGKPDGLEMLEAFSRYDIHDYARKAAAERAMASRGNLDLHVFPVALAAAQRPRRPGYEWQLDHPARYICDLSGQMPVQAYQAAQAFSDACEAANPSAPPPLLETSALQACVERHLAQAGNGQAAGPAATELWQAQAAATDALHDSRTRQLCAVLLDDPIYRIRHLKQRLESQQALLRTCIERATLHPHHGSALLLQQMVLPAHIGGQQNPLSASLEKISERGKRDINRFTATPERMLAWDHLAHSQRVLAACLGDSRQQQALADHLSLDGFEYLGEFHFASQLLPLLACAPAQLDPLAANGAIIDALSNLSTLAPDVTPGQALIDTIARDTAHPLHGMFWPATDPEKLLEPYQKPAQAQANAGDGQFRAEELAQFETLEAPDNEPATLNAALLAGLLQTGSLHNALVANAKAGANALHEIYANFSGAVEAAQRALLQAQERQRLAEQERRQAQQERSASRHGQAQASRERQAAEQAQRQAEAARRQRSAEAQRSDHELEQARQAERNQRATLGEQARPAHIRLHGQGVEQLRGMLQRSFGEARFIRRSAAKAGAYYLFGLEELPGNEQRPIRLYGEYLNGQGRPFATSNQRIARGAGLEPLLGEHLVLALPHNHHTAQAVRRLNQAIGQAMQAQQVQQRTQAAQRQASTRAAEAAQEAARARAAEAARNGRVQTADDAARAARQHGLQARSGLQDAIRHLQSQQNNLFYQALNGRVFPASVLILELYNVKVELSARHTTSLEKSKERMRFGVTGAVLDLLIAMEALTYKLAGNNSILAIAQKPLINVPREFAIKLLGKSLGRRFVEVITARLIAQTVSGLVMVGICLYDAWYAWRWNDDAVWGYLLMASGAAVGTLGGLFLGGGSLLGPPGWLALLLIGGGAGLVYWLGNTPLEDWLGNGPFGDNRDQPHLQEPREAFYRLLGLFAGPTVRVEANPDYDPNAKLDMHEQLPYPVRSANTLVRIETYLPGLLGTREGGSIRAECRLRTIETRYRYNLEPLPDSLETQACSSVPVAQVAWPGSLTLYFHTPPAGRWAGNPRDSSRRYEWGVRMQASLELAEDIWTFPAPLPKTPRRDAASQAFAAQPEIFYPISPSQEPR